MWQCTLRDLDFPICRTPAEQLALDHDGRLNREYITDQNLWRQWCNHMGWNHLVVDASEYMRPDGSRHTPFEPVPSASGQDMLRKVEAWFFEVRLQIAALDGGRLSASSLDKVGTLLLLIHQPGC